MLNTRVFSMVNLIIPILCVCLLPTVLDNIVTTLLWRNWMHAFKTMTAWWSPSENINFSSSYPLQFVEAWHMQNGSKFIHSKPTRYWQIGLWKVPSFKYPTVSWRLTDTFILDYIPVYFWPIIYSCYWYYNFQMGSTGLLTLPNHGVYLGTNSSIPQNANADLSYLYKFILNSFQSGWLYNILWHSIQNNGKKESMNKSKLLDGKLDNLELI